jgi:ATP-binding cassette, subfamily B, bacterial
VDRLKGEVVFRNVSFSYGGKEPVLENVSWHIRPREQVAIVGPSGVGKTTLLSLLLRFYKPTAGEVYFDGLPTSDLDLGSLRRRFGYVAQNTTLLAGTILENIRYGNPEATEEQVLHVAGIAGIHDFISSLPQGYDSLIGERGVNLSEGQKQRISIARALIRDPDILILDEPTSALDSLTEKSIFQSFGSLLKDKTIFVVAHRLSTVQEADQIALLNEKRLVSIGTHESLLASDHYYQSLALHQRTYGAKEANRKGTVAVGFGA